MKYKKIIKDNYEIYFYKTNKFKTINLTTVLIDDFNKDNITMDNFISSYILETSKKYNTEVSYNKKLLDLYNPRLSVYDFYRDYHYKFYEISFINDKFLDEENNKKVIDFYYDMMFNPNEENNSFIEEYSNVIKNQMKLDFNLQKENPSHKAYFDSIKLISEDFQVKYDSRGKLSDLKKINDKDSYKYYMNELKNSKYIVFITSDSEDIIDLVSNILDKKVIKKDISIIDNYEVKEVKKVKEKIEKTNFNQSIIYLYYKLINTTKRERDIVLPLLNNILGGPSSKLFNNVREKYSLAYYAYSGFIKNYNYLYIYAGINSKNYNKALDVIFNEVDNMKKGNITKEELEDSKSMIISTLLKKDENTFQILNDMVNSALFNRLDTNELISEIKTVTKEEIVILSNKLMLDVNYLLRGDKNENN